MVGEGSDHIFSAAWCHPWGKLAVARSAATHGVLVRKLRDCSTVFMHICFFPLFTSFAEALYNSAHFSDSFFFRCWILGQSMLAFSKCLGTARPPRGCGRSIFRSGTPPPSARSLSSWQFCSRTTTTCRVFGGIAPSTLCGNQLDGLPPVCEVHVAGVIRGQVRTPPFPTPFPAACTRISRRSRERHLQLF